MYWSSVTIFLLHYMCLLKLLQIGFFQMVLDSWLKIWNVTLLFYAHNSINFDKIFNINVWNLALNNHVLSLSSPPKCDSKISNLSNFTSLVYPLYNYPWECDNHPYILLALMNSKLVSCYNSLCIILVLLCVQLYSVVCSYLSVLSYIFLFFYVE